MATDSADSQVVQPELEQPNHQSEKASPARCMWRIFRGIVGVGLLIIALAVGALAAAPYFPGIDYLGAGTLITPQFVGPLIAIACGVFVLSVILILLRGRVTGVCAFIVSVASVVSLSVVLDQQVKFARDEGAEIDVAQAFNPEDLTGGSPDETVPYGNGPDGPLNMDVYRPQSQEPAPVVLYVHGGGWDQMDRGSQSRNMRWLADHGFLVLSADYTLATDERPTWDIAANEIACALSWVKTESPALGGDASRFYTYGESAGGALAMRASYDAAAGQSTGECGDQAVPTAVYTDSPAVDPRAIAANQDPVVAEGSQETVEKYLGGTPQQFPERADSVTVAHHVTEQSQPTYVARSEFDRLVPPQSYSGYRSVMGEHGRELTEVVRPRADHASALTYYGVWNQMLQQTMLEFFTQQGAFGEPRNPMLREPDGADA